MNQISMVSYKNQTSFKDKQRKKDESNENIIKKLMEVQEDRLTGEEKGD